MGQICGSGNDCVRPNAVEADRIPRAIGPMQLRLIGFHVRHAILRSWESFAFRDAVIGIGWIANALLPPI
jgi:hypothetical protein